MFGFETKGHYHSDKGGLPVFKIVEDGSLVEAGEFGHVFHLVEFRRIHLLNIVFGNVELFPRVQLDLMDSRVRGKEGGS